MTEAFRALRDADRHLRHLLHRAMPRKNANRDLGRALANKKDRAKAAANHKKKAADTSDAGRHVTDEGGRPELRSVLESNDLEELMLNATMANKDFAAQRYAGPVAPQTVVVTPVGATTPAARARVRRKMAEMDSSVLKVPRRPSWDKATTAGDLQKQEVADFLVWRRRIASLEEELAHEQGHAGVMLTPFEKNLEVWRQLWRVVERSDLVVQIVDARNPLLYYCADLARYVEGDMRRGHMLVLNKADLLSSAMISRWEAYFAEQGVDVAFFSAFKASVGDDVHDPRIVGARELIERLSGAQRTAPVQQPRLVVGMCGYPNVGKSSTINVLLDTATALEEESAVAEVDAVIGDEGSTDVGSTTTAAERAVVAAKRVAVSSTPGRTKHFQTLVLTDDVLLCDCPGLVFPNFSASKSELICAGVLSIDQMRADTLVPIELIARRIPSAVFEGVYGIRFEEARAHLLSDGRAERDRARGVVDATTLLETHARARGFMTDHGRPDASRSARAVLKDYVSGRVRFAHAPPPDDEADGESGVGPDVFAKKGRLVIARREAAGRESAAAAAKAAGEAKGAEGLQNEAAKPVVARVSQRKKHAHAQFTRVQRNYGSSAQ